MIQFPNGFLVECIGGYGKSSVCDLLIHYYNCIEVKNDENRKPDLCIILTEKDYKTKINNKQLTIPCLLGPQTKEELDSLKLMEVPLYTVAFHEVYTMYKQLQFPIYDYINLGLVLGAYKLSNIKIEHKSDINLINLKDSCISIEIEKNFSLRYSMMNENIRLIYESGISEIGTLLCMEWVKMISRNCPIFTIFDIDEEDLQGKELIDFLIPFTILGNLQNGFLIVNSDIERSSDSSESSESFDFSLYTTLKSIWNSKEYIPRRKKLSIPLPDYQMFRDNDLDDLSSKINFEECIRKPPIFIIDTFDEIKKWIQDQTINFSDLEQTFIYVGKRKNIRI